MLENMLRRWATIEVHLRNQFQSKTKKQVKQSEKVKWNETKQKATKQN